MQEQTNTRAMVDILSEQTRRDVVMNGDKYVYLDTKEQVTKDDIETALTKFDEEKANIELEQKQQESRDYLDSTDWYVVRFSETGVEIPQEVKTKRAEHRVILS